MPSPLDLAEVVVLGILVVECFLLHMRVRDLQGSHANAMGHILDLTGAEGEQDKAIAQLVEYGKGDEEEIEELRGELNNCYVRLDELEGVVQGLESWRDVWEQE